MWRACTRRKSGVTLRAQSVADCGKLDVAQMFDVTRTARGHESLRSLVDGPVVTREARLIGHRMAEGSSVRDVAGRAFLPKNCMRL